MRPRILVLAALGSVLAGALWWAFHPAAPPVEASKPSRRAAALAFVDTSFPWRDATSFPELHAMLHDAYRLAPDARFLGAVGEVKRLAGGGTGDSVRATWSGDRWIVRCGADSVGELPEYPGYADARRMLVAWAARTVRPAPDSVTVAAAPFPQSPFEALDAIERRWRRGDRGPASFADAGEALAWLVFATSFDRTRQSDAIAARSLAAVAIAEAGGVARERTHVLLAGLLGYERESRELARTLAPADGRRAWAEGDTAALAWLARSPGDRRERRLLELHALARMGRLEAWESALDRDRDEDAPTDDRELETGLGLSRFESATALAQQTVVRVALETQRWRGVDTLAVMAALRGYDLPARLEKLLVAGAPRGGGPLLDVRLANAYARAQLYTALTLDAEHRYGDLFLESTCREFARRLGAPGPGFAGEFSRWFGDLVCSSWPVPADSVPPLVNDLLAARTLSPEQLELTYDRALDRSSDAAPALTRSLVHRMDTRPRDRAWLATASLMHDLVLEGRDSLLAASAAAGGIKGGTAALWLARERGDDEGFVRLMGAADVPARSKSWMLGMLSLPDVPLVLVQRAGDAASALHPDDAPIARAHAYALEKHGQIVPARRVLEAWLEHDVEDPGALVPSSVRMDVAKLFRKAGEPERALGVLQDDRSGMFGVLSEEARALDAVGRADDAMKLAQRTIERYGGESAPYGLVARLHWAHGRDSAAAEALKPRLDDNTFWNRDLPADFVDCFRGRPKEAIAAVRVMAGAFGNRRGQLAGIAYTFAREGDPETGFAVMQASLSSGLQRAFDVVAGYDLVKQARGEREALAWIQAFPIHSASAREIAFETVAAHGHPEVAWIDTLPADPNDRDWALLVRAPGLATLAADDPRREWMRRELHAREGGYYLTLARYVAEGGDVGPSLRCADNLKHRVEVYFWIGRRAEIEGRDDDAAACYQLCRETAQLRQGEWNWSRYRLAKLLDKPSGPARAKASPAARRVAA
jgi:hypothetical protein